MRAWKPSETEGDMTAQCEDGKEIKKGKKMKD
jgi:hypothetical protein